MMRDAGRRAARRRARRRTWARPAPRSAGSFPSSTTSTPPTSADDRDPSRLLELILGVVGRLAAERAADARVRGRAVGRPARRSTCSRCWSPGRRPPAAARVHRAVRRAASRSSVPAHGRALGAAADRPAARAPASRAARRRRPDRGDPRRSAPTGSWSTSSPSAPRASRCSSRSCSDVTRDGRVDRDYLPPSLRDVLLARAELLSPSAQHVLRVVSAAARWAPDRLLALVAGLPEPELHAALREAVEQQLLVVDASGRGYGFRHALARAAIHDDLLPGERTQLHKAYAEALEDNAELAGSDLDASSMLAHHWLAAHDLPRALPASVRAGKAAAAAGRRRPPSATSSSPSSCGPRCPTQRSEPGSTIPSCSRRRRRRRPGPGRSIAAWRWSIRRWPRSATAGRWSAARRCSCAAATLLGRPRP